MSEPIQLNLPQLTPPPPMRKLPDRAVQDDVPPTLGQRRHVRDLCREYVARVKPVPPLSLDELRVHARVLLEEKGLDDLFTEYTAILINNEAWRDKLAAVPFHKRLLLVPKCLRPEDNCSAPFDEFGLLCKQCGNCSLQDFQEEAERMGYAVLIAEGSALVMKIIETRKIEAIVGVSCLSVLERAFPYMEATAIPGVAVPLLQDDCRDTNVDIDWVWEYIHLTSEDRTWRLDLDEMRGEVDTWFSDESLDRLMGPVETATQKIGREWLQRDGKRWRPFLTACAYRAVMDDPDLSVSDDLIRLAIAVECFHKASLVHDDIEDEDDTRYDSPTVHAEHGIAVALNVGDWLLGEGYRMIGEAEGAGDRMGEMLRVASTGHRDLTLGQGDELTWQRNPTALKTTQVLEIFRRKTAPAFEVALRLGALLAGADRKTLDVIGAYSEAIGIAYQIRDDMQDWLESEGESDAAAMRPTLLPAIALERATDENRAPLDALWSRTASRIEIERVKSLIAELKVAERAGELLEAYKQKAAMSLGELTDPTLKGLLRRVMGKIFNDAEIEGWCREFEAANAAGRAAGAESAA